MIATEDDLREKKLRQLARVTGGPPCASKDVDEPLLALIRNGDQGDDINDAIAHLAVCADCRARLTEGEVERRKVVVVAIEAPKASQHDLAKAVQDSQARLFERGDGRWTAVVDAEKSDTLVRQLEGAKGESSVVSRLALAQPVEILLDFDGGRGPMPSMANPTEYGTDAAEVQAWAHIARTPKQKVPGANPSWAIFAVLSVIAAAAIAYWLATR